MLAKVNGIQIYYEEWGDGLPILLIHPAGGSASTWGAIPDGLAKVGRVIAYDRRGYVRSGGQIVRSINQHTDDAGALLDSLDAKPAVIVGASVGANIAIDLAIRRPELVRSVIAYESPWRAYRHPDLSALRILATTWLLAQVGRDSEAASTFMRWAYLYPEGDSAWNMFPDGWRRTALESAQATVADVWIAIGRYPNTKDLATITAPIVCAHGTRTRPALVATARALVGAIPNSKLREVEGASHSIAFDAPAAFVQLVISEVPDLSRRSQMVA